VITTDALVEGVHFRTETMTYADIGWRALAANISDIAAMGARPVLGTVALGMPDDFGLARIRELYEGLNALAQDARCAIVGGDLTRSPVLSLAITAIGEVRPSNLKTRTGARPGDVLAVTGPLGASRAGLMLAEKKVQSHDPKLAEEALLAHRRPEPRWREGMWLAASSYVHAMMDLSDGLSTDARRLAAASRCAAVIDAHLPVAASAAAVAAQVNQDPREFALAGGEEYELLAAVDARAFDYLSARFAAHFGRPLLRAGTFRAGEGLFGRDGDADIPLEQTGWDHFHG